MTGQFDKHEVRYEYPARGMDHCRDCRHFEVLKRNGCEIVRGYIQAGGWCEKFKRAPHVPAPPRRDE